MTEAKATFPQQKVCILTSGKRRVDLISLSICTNIIIYNNINYTYLIKLLFILDGLRSTFKNIQWLYLCFKGNLVASSGTDLAEMEYNISEWALYIYMGGGPSSIKPTMLHHHVSIVAQNRQTLTPERNFCIFCKFCSDHRFSYTLGRVGWVEGYSVGCNLQLHC